MRKTVAVCLAIPALAAGEVGCGGEMKDIGSLTLEPIQNLLKPFQ